MAPPTSRNKGTRVTPLFQDVGGDSADGHRISMLRQNAKNFSMLHSILREY